MNPSAPRPTNPSDRRTDHALLVVGFCAAWCDTCGEFRRAFRGLAAMRPEARFVWLDIEDDAHLVGDIDIENFPTIAVFRDDRPVHFGVSLPQGPVVGRLLDSFEVTSRTIATTDAVATLPGRLAKQRTPPADSGR